MVVFSRTFLVLLLPFSFVYRVSPSVAFGSLSSTRFAFVARARGRAASISYVSLSAFHCKTSNFRERSDAYIQLRRGYILISNSNSHFRRAPEFSPEAPSQRSFSTNRRQEQRRRSSLSPSPVSFVSRTASRRASRVTARPGLREQLDEIIYIFYIFRVYSPPRGE